MVDGGVLNCVSQFGLRLSPFDRYVPSSPVICNFLIIFVTKILLSTSIQIIIFLIKSLKPNYNFFYKKKDNFFPIKKIFIFMTDKFVITEFLYIKGKKKVITLFVHYLKILASN